MGVGSIKSEARAGTRAAVAGQTFRRLLAKHVSARRGRPRPAQNEGRRISSVGCWRTARGNCLQPPRATGRVELGPKQGGQRSLSERRRHVGTSDGTQSRTSSIQFRLGVGEPCGRLASRFSHGGARVPDSPGSVERSRRNSRLAMAFSGTRRSPSCLLRTTTSFFSNRRISTIQRSPPRRRISWGASDSTVSNGPMA